MGFKCQSISEYLQKDLCDRPEQPLANQILITLTQQLTMVELLHCKFEFALRFLHLLESHTASQNQQEMAVSMSQRNKL